MVKDDAGRFFTITGWHLEETPARIEHRSEEIAQLHADVRQEVDEAVAWAEQSPYPDPSVLLDDVYEQPSGGTAGE